MFEGRVRMIFCADSVELNSFLTQNISLMFQKLFNMKGPGKSSSCCVSLRVIPGNGRLKVTESQLVD